MNGSRVISVGIFFDGTGNNGVNALSSDKPLNNNESYHGAFTNIYKLYKLFIGNEKIYIEGIGTVTGSEDNNFAIATCANPPYGKGYSSDDKLQKAEDFVRKIIHDQDDEYHFYLYGFGRGGMLARAFSHWLFSNYSFTNIKIKFLGAFDTVESKPFNTYNLNVSHHIEKALHICAANESRFFFPLTGFFENSSMMKDSQLQNNTSVLKEIFVPGVHADIGGGYLEGPQSVYISTDFANSDDLKNYVQNIRNGKKGMEGSQVWDTLLSGFGIERKDAFSKAYISRDKVYSELSKIYGKLMLKESNEVSTVFKIGNDLEIDYNRHAVLEDFYEELQDYVEQFSAVEKPSYNYRKLADYIHIAANFGLYHDRLKNRSEYEMNVELLNNGLNVSSSTTVDQKNNVRLSVELHLPEDSFVTDFLYGTNVPNNDIWTRSIIKTPVTRLVK